MVALDSCMQELIYKLRSEMLAIWPCQTIMAHLNPEISLEQFYADACLPPHAAAWEYRFNFTKAGRLLRRELADSMPAMLGMMGPKPPEEIMLVSAGEVFQRGSTDELKSHHEVELWRLVDEDVSLDCVDTLIKILARILPIRQRLRTRRCTRAYLIYGLVLEVYGQGIWKRIGHCGLMNPMLLIEHGMDSASANGLVLNMDLSLCLDLLLRSTANT